MVEGVVRPQVLGVSRGMVFKRNQKKQKRSWFEVAGAAASPPRHSPPHSSCASRACLEAQGSPWVA